MILSGGTLYLGQPDGSWAELGSITSAELTFEPAADEPPAPFDCAYSRRLRARRRRAR